MYKKTKKLENFENFFIIFTFILYFFIGSQIYTDYGFYIDEKFHRANGFYWLNFISDFLGFENLKQISKIKLDLIQDFTLPEIKKWNQYGVIFDLPAAYLEIFFNLNEPIKYFRFRHFLVFIIFFLGSIYFYRIIFNRFNNKLISLLGFILLILTPRIFGDAFWNNKDIIFLSIYIISIYFYFKFIDLPSYKNLILFSLFSAIATSMRIAGIFLPFSFLLFYLFDLISNKNKIEINFIFLLLISYIFFLTISWPLLWQEWPSSLFTILNLEMSWGGQVHFLGDYYRSQYLPQYYLVFWILVTTPVLHIILFFHGFINYSKRIIMRYFKIEKLNIYSDLWRSRGEKKDFFIFLNLVLFICALSFLNVDLYNSWRLGYFIYIFIIYFSTYSIYLIFKIKFRHFLKKLAIFLILIFFLIFRNYLYHPYQSVYFNFLVPENIKNKLDVNCTGLSGIGFLKKIIKEEPGTHEIKIGVNSWYPLWRMVELLDKKDQARIKILKNDKKYEANYLYSNRIYDVDKRYYRKYDVPINFNKIEEFKIDNTIIYEVYKRSK